MDVSTLVNKQLAEYVRYLDTCENEYIDYEEAPRLEFKDWWLRENPEDPDTDA